jgi:hypothetical protein
MGLHTDDAWNGAAGTFFNPHARFSLVPLAAGQHCVVVDDVLADPQALRGWASRQAALGGFLPPAGYPYPGLVLPAPAALSLRVADHFTQHVRQRLGARRTLDAVVRLSMVTVPAAALEPRQWQCHRDRVSSDPGILFAASVLYLFRDAALGGTSFYVPRRSPQDTDQMLADSQLLDAASFSARHGVQPGYMAGSNDWFERIARVPAAWNRAIFYDGSQFHSADVDAPAALCADPSHGRLTLNSFFTCRRNAS